MDKEEIYNYLWTLGILEAKSTRSRRRDSIIEEVRGGKRLQFLFSDEEWIILRGMITRMDRNIKLNNLLTE